MSPEESMFPGRFRPVNGGFRYTGDPFAQESTQESTWTGIAGKISTGVIGPIPRRPDQMGTWERLRNSGINM
jgi:hypothetical protein